MTTAQSSDYQIGQVVGYAARAFRDKLPLPRQWFILEVQQGRDGKVIEAFQRRDISGLSLTITRYIDRRTGGVARAPHLGRKVTTRMLPGLIFVPDFDICHEGLGEVEHVLRWLQIGSRIARLSIEDMQKLREIEAGESAHKRLPRDARWRRGDKVRIVDGPFASFAACVESLDSRGRLKVFVDSLMRGVSVELAETQVEPV